MKTSGPAKALGYLKNASTPPKAHLKTFTKFLKESDKNSGDAGIAVLGTNPNSKGCRSTGTALSHSWDLFR